MVKQKRGVLTEKERRILDKIAECISVVEAAQELGLSVRTLYNVLYRIRNKYRKARLFVNTILAYRRKDRILARVLTKNIPMEKELGLDEE